MLKPILVSIAFATGSLIVTPGALADERAPKHKRGKNKKGSKRGKGKKRRPKKQNKADVHFKNGVQLFDEQKFAEALAEFEQAYVLQPHPLVLYNLAGAHRALSQYTKAFAFYNRFLAEAVGQVDDELLHQGRSEFDELLTLVARVDISTTPDGASVQVDGEPMGRTPLSNQIILGPGDHRIVVSLDGYEDNARKFRVAAGDTLKVDLTLKSEESKSEDGDQPVDEAPEPALSTSSASKRFSLNAGMGTNALEISTTGTPSLGGEFAISDRLSVGADVLVTALSAIPAVRYRFFGSTLSMHAVLAAPINFQDGGESSVFAAGAGGVGLRFRATNSIALRLESWVAYAGKKRGTTLPSFAAAEMFF